MNCHRITLCPELKKNKKNKKIFITFYPLTQTEFYELLDLNVLYAICFRC